MIGRRSALTGDAGDGRREPVQGRLRRRAALSVAVAALLLAVPATASARIIPQRGMLGVELGDTVREVRAQLGPPERAGAYRPGPIINRIFLYHRGKTIIGFHGAGRRARVIQLVTRSRRERLANGAGVGTTKDDLIRKMPRLTCPDDESHCYLGRILELGQPVTDFNLDRNDVVVAVEVARLPD
jgi:hypothetical protein